MAARPRKKKYRNLPEHLYFDESKQVFRFALVNGVRKNLGKDADIAIAAAREYNNIMRVTQKLTVDSLVRESGGVNGEAAPLSDYIDSLMERIIRDESPAKNTLADWLNDAKRVKEFFNIPCIDIDLSHVNDYINTYHATASANVQNRKVLFLKKIFSYAIDESLMIDNPASRKKMKKTEAKKRKRLTPEWFLMIRTEAEPWLRTAMNLALQTTQARLEVSRIRYSIKRPKEGVCGCVWFKEPVNGIFGTLYIHRQKTRDKEAAHVAIPIGEVLKAIIDDSRDNVLSPYVVHRMPTKGSNKMSDEVDHITQVAPDYISRAFSELRDKVGVAKDLPPEQRPTFHEIRALAAIMLENQGVDPQSRMAHSDAKSTKIYTQNHVDWVEVPHAEILIA